MPIPAPIQLPADDPELLIPSETAAAARGMTVASLAGRRNVGKLPVPPSLRVGHRRFYRSSDVRAWVLHGDAAIAGMQPFDSETPPRPESEGRRESLGDPQPTRPHCDVTITDEVSA